MAMMKATAEQIRATPGMAAWVGLIMKDYWRWWGSRKNERLQRLPEALDCQIFVYGVEQNVNEPALIVEGGLEDREKRRRMQGLGFVQALSQKNKLENKGKRRERGAKGFPLSFVHVPSHKSHVQENVAQFHNAVVSVSTCNSGDEWILESPGR